MTDAARPGLGGEAARRGVPRGRGAARPGSTGRPTTARVRIAGVLLLLLTAAGPATAHEVRPAYLEIAQEGADRVRVLFKLPVTGDMVALPLSPRLPDRWREVGGRRLTRAPDAIVLESIYAPGGPLPGQQIAIEGLSATLTDALVRVTLLEGPTFTRILNPASPSFEIPDQAAAPTGGYLLLGIEHILRGVDHLLFVLGLLVIVGRRWALMLKTITAFTFAHSLALGLATLGAVRVPPAPLNATIALSILFLGVEIARQRRGGTSFTIAHPWAAALAFGLLHGLGFASGLGTLGLTPSELAVALLLFNVGVELGQIAFVGLYLALEQSLRTLEVPAPRWAEALPGIVVGLLGAYWTIAQTVLLVSGA
jgi:hypothetical protein